MRDASPRHVGDVEESVDAAEIDERAEVGDVLDDALSDLVLLEPGRNASTPMRSTTTPPLIFLTRVPSTG